MVATSRIEFPADMSQAIRPAVAPSLESYAAEVFERVKDYAKEEPVAFGLWAFGIGFVLGWKLKPW